MKAMGGRYSYCDLWQEIDVASSKIRRNNEVDENVK